MSLVKPDIVNDSEKDKDIQDLFVILVLFGKLPSCSWPHFLKPFWINIQKIREIGLGRFIYETDPMPGMDDGTPDLPPVRWYDYKESSAELLECFPYISVVINTGEGYPFYLIIRSIDDTVFLQMCFDYLYVRLSDLNDELFSLTRPSIFGASSKVRSGTSSGDSKEKTRIIKEKYFISFLMTLVMARNPGYFSNDNFPLSFYRSKKLSSDGIPSWWFIEYIGKIVYPFVR